MPACRGMRVVGKETASQDKGRETLTGQESDRASARRLSCLPFRHVTCTVPSTELVDAVHQLQPRAIICLSSRAMSAARGPPLLPAAHASALVSSFTSFLTIAVHSLLYHRRLYPPATFLLARAYNLPVHQSRHPAVCAWIRDAVAAVAVHIRAAAARRVALAVHHPTTSAVVERWIFDLTGFPTEPCLAATDDGPRLLAREDFDEQSVNWTDVHEALRGALRRLASAGESMPPPPPDSTFTLAVELRDDASAPIQVSHLAKGRRRSN